MNENMNYELYVNGEVEICARYLAMAHTLAEDLSDNAHVDIVDAHTGEVMSTYENGRETYRIPEPLKYAYKVINQELDEVAEYNLCFDESPTERLEEVLYVMWGLSPDNREWKNELKECQETVIRYGIEYYILTCNETMNQFEIHHA